MNWLIEHEITVHGLAHVVADEKTHTLNQQRPAIWALCKSSLRQLILRIFEGMGEDHYKDGALDQDFGLSKATFSRFAGSLLLLAPGAYHENGPLILDTPMTLASAGSAVIR